MSDSQALIDKGKLRDKRIRAGMTRSELARQAELHRSHIDFLERGSRDASPKTLVKLAGIFGCDISELMPDKVAA